MKHRDKPQKIRLGFGKAQKIQKLSVLKKWNKIFYKVKWHLKKKKRQEKINQISERRIILKRIKKDNEMVAQLLQFHNVGGYINFGSLIKKRYNWNTQI